MINNLRHTTIAFVLTLFIGCSAPVDPDQLYSRCKNYLQNNFINDSDSAETKKGLLEKMQLACERARSECRNNPDGSNCVRSIKKYRDI